MAYRDSCALQIATKNSHGLSRFQGQVLVNTSGPSLAPRESVRANERGRKGAAVGAARARAGQRHGAAPRRRQQRRFPRRHLNLAVGGSAFPLKPRTRARETRPPCPRGHPPPHRGKPSFFFRRLLPNARLSTCVEAVAIGDESNNYYINTSSCGAPPQPAPVKVPPGGDHPQSACAHRSQPIPDRSAVHAAARSRGASAP